MRSAGWVSVAFSLLLVGCAGARGVAGLPSDSVPRAASISSVPFFPDTTDQCGPSTLAAVLTFWGRPVTPSQLKAEIYIPKLKGTLPMDLVSAVESRGLRADGSNASPELLKAELSAGRPVLAYIDRGFGFYPIGHYVVVTGFDDARKGYTMHTGRHKNRFVSYRKFEKEWGRTNRWMLLVSSPVETEARR